MLAEQVGATSLSSRGRALGLANHMEDPEATCSALLAYTNAVLTEEATVNESVNSVEDALSDNVLLAAVGRE